MTTMTASIAGFTFDDILLNAAGVYCQTTEELDQILEAPGAGSLVTKSATPMERPGNPGVRYADMALGSFNGSPKFELRLLLGICNCPPS